VPKPVSSDAIKNTPKPLVKSKPTNPILKINTKETDNDTLESPKKRQKLDSLSSINLPTTNHVSSPKRSMSTLDSYQSDILAKLDETSYGYQLLYTKLSIEAKSLCSVLPTANKVVTTKNWRVFF
jgi:hypothetical protein